MASCALPMWRLPPIGSGRSGPPTSRYSAWAPLWAKSETSCSSCATSCGRITCPAWAIRRSRRRISMRWRPGACASPARSPSRRSAARRACPSTPAATWSPTARTGTGCRCRCISARWAITCARWARGWRWLARRTCRSTSPDSTGSGSTGPRCTACWRPRPVSSPSTGTTACIRAATARRILPTTGI